MPVRRYDDLDAAERDLWLDASDPSLGEHIRRVWSFAEQFAMPAVIGVTRVRLGETPGTTLPATRGVRGR